MTETRGGQTGDEKALRKLRKQLRVLAENLTLMGDRQGAAEARSLRKQLVDPEADPEVLERDLRRASVELLTRALRSNSTQYARLAEATEQLLTEVPEGTAAEQVAQLSQSQVTLKRVSTFYSEAAIALARGGLRGRNLLDRALLTTMTELEALGKMPGED